jgi:hypothetical protein
LEDDKNRFTDDIINNERVYAKDRSTAISGAGILK